jgi:hypothetical protein
MPSCLEVDFDFAHVLMFTPYGSLRLRVGGEEVGGHPELDAHGLKLILAQIELALQHLYAPPHRLPRVSSSRLPDVSARKGCASGDENI